MSEGARAEFEFDEPTLRAWARELGARLRGGDVVLLRGAMGSGKTTLTRALAEGLGIARPERVCSPTYTVCMVHRAGARGVGLVHLDLFRLGEQGGGPVGAAAFESLGLEHDELPGPARVLVVEWPEFWAEAPAERLTITLDRPPGSEHSRRLSLGSEGDSWAGRVPFEFEKEE